jgi:predicted lipoprotein
MSFFTKLKPLAIACGLAFTVSACSEKTESTQGPSIGKPVDPGTQFDEKALVANLVDNIITPTFQSFSTTASNTLNTVTSYCAIEADGEKTAAEKQTALDAAQQSWRDAMVVWQHAELMQLGPLKDDDGQLRNLIYAWPAKSLCGVDQDVVYFEDGQINKDPSKPYDIALRTATRRGLTSLEHLLFSTNYDHSCSIANEALADWNARTVEARKVSRCNFAVEVSKDLEANAQLLTDKWLATDGYAAALKNAGEPGNQFESAHKAVNVISDALFYMTEQLKDKKLGLPLGYESNSCGLEACPQDVESSIATHSLQNILANLDAFEKLFTGNGNNSEVTTGFDDFLVEEGGTDTRDLMLKGIADSRAATNAISGNLQQALTTENEKVVETHNKVKDITDQLKHDFINKLALELPKSSAGDND